MVILKVEASITNLFSHTMTTFMFPFVATQFQENKKNTNIIIQNKIKKTERLGRRRKRGTKTNLYLSEQRSISTNNRRTFQIPGCQWPLFVLFSFSFFSSLSLFIPLPFLKLKLFSNSNNPSQTRNLLHHGFLIKIHVLQDGLVSFVSTMSSQVFILLI